MALDETWKSKEISVMSKLDILRTRVCSSASYMLVKHG